MTSPEPRAGPWAGPKAGPWAAGYGQVTTQHAVARGRGFPVPWSQHTGACRVAAEGLSLRPAPWELQGLLQYFRLVEGCLEMVLARERLTGKRYKWIVRARVDAFWRGPAPALSSLNASAYNIPYGNDFSGYNDRFGAGRHWPAEVSMPAPERDGRRRGVQQVLHAQLGEGVQDAVRGEQGGHCAPPHPLLPSSRTACRPRSWATGDPAVPSIASDLDLDGTKCMPCQACNARPNVSLRLRVGRPPCQACALRPSVWAPHESPLLSARAVAFELVRNNACVPACTWPSACPWPLATLPCRHPWPLSLPCS